MSSSADKPSTSATAPPLDGRRRRDAQASRRALLEAADALFDERGYDATTVREIGERAGVDAALIARYFDSKEGLYLATLQQEGRPEMPTDPVQAFAAMLTKSERGIGPVPLAMVSPTLTDGIRDQVRAIIERRVVEPLAAELAARGTPDRASCASRSSWRWPSACRSPARAARCRRWPRRRWMTCSPCWSR